MSYWVSLQDAEDCVSVDNFTDGGTYTVGGSGEADLNITYNYGKRYKEVIPNYCGLVDLLHLKKASDVTQTLEDAVHILGTEQSDDYWQPTAGNAGYALHILLQWAKQYPDAVFHVN